MERKGCLDSKKWQWKKWEQGSSNEEGGQGEQPRGGGVRKGDHGRKNKKQKGENVLLQKLGRDQLWGSACGSGFIFVWFIICLKLEGLSWPLLIYTRRQHPWMWPQPYLGLERKAGARNEAGGSESCLFQGWNLKQNFMVSKKKILSVYKQESMSEGSWRSWGCITIKCLRPWKFRRREPDLTTSGAWGFIELVKKIISAKYFENIW